MQIAFLLAAGGAAHAGTVFTDNFAIPGTTLDLNKWTTQIGAGSTVGRTELQNWVTPGAGGQFDVGASGAQLTVNSYNPDASGTLLGTQAKTINAFEPTATTTISFDTDLQLTSVEPGLVYSMYFYDCPITDASCGNPANEIDIELLTNLLQSGQKYVELNRYTANSPDTGDGGLFALPTNFNPLASHDWTIRWSNSEIDYLVDGTLLDSVYSGIPQGDLRANVLGFAPNSNWTAAYNPVLQPTASAGQNQSYTALLTGVTISSATPEPAAWSLLLLGLIGVWWNRAWRSANATLTVVRGCSSVW